MFCQNCGQQYDESRGSCPRCGALRPASVVYIQQTPPQKSNGMAVAGFILSLLGFFSSGMTVILQLLGFIFSCIGLSRTKEPNVSGKGLAVAGIVLGSLAFCFAIILYSMIFSITSG